MTLEVVELETVAPVLTEQDIVSIVVHAQTVALQAVASDEGFANVAAVQYVDGAWVDVEVVEVRADYVVLDLKQNGRQMSVSVFLFMQNQ